ncbi:J domain-containing protein [Sorangium sp. So ce327]|jgi:curved DNA-binding protein CbpA|uniref:J domain-containing protein n=1 Tax=Sorangium sp. So ce327 TaxID=3133301 RepID=UPI003F61DC5A
MDPTYYQVLGVREDASADAIKAAFRELVKKHHPDRNHGDTGAEMRLKKIVAAYAVLANAETRGSYDRDLATQRAAASVRAAAERTIRATRAGRPVWPPPRPAPTPAPQATSPSWGAVAFFATLFGVGLGAALASGSGTPNARWDHRAGRYRDSCGRFTSG